MPTFSWKLGRVADIDLILHPTLLLIPLFLLSTGGDGFTVLVAAAAFGCVLLHEFGHALAARIYGIETRDITLYPIGGIARLARMPRSAGPELLISIAGPAVNVALAAAIGVFQLAAGPALGDSLASAFLVNMFWINVGLFVFNMLPVYPMDGGRVLRAALSGFVGRQRATLFAGELARVVAVVAGTWFLFHGHVLQALMALFIFATATMEMAAVRRPEGPKDGPDDWPKPPPGERWVNRGDGVYRLEPIRITWGQGSGSGRGPRPWR